MSLLQRVGGTAPEEMLLLGTVPGVEGSHRLASQGKEEGGKAKGLACFLISSLAGLSGNELSIAKGMQAIWLAIFSRDLRLRGDCARGF